MYSELFHILKTIESNAFSFSEGWGFLQMRSKVYNDLQNELSSLKQQLSLLKCHLTFQIDGEYVQIDDIKEYTINDSLTININKIELEINNGIFQFFYDKESFLEWIKNISPFDPEYPINKFKHLKIVVNKLKNSFAGVNFAVVKKADEDFSESLFILPKEREITQIVHCVSEKQISINPYNHIIISSLSQDEFASPFLKNSAIILVSSIVNEFYSLNKVILNGIKRVQLVISNENTVVDLNLVHKLAEVVSWIYEDKVETRRKLFVDRITLDINYDLPFIDELKRVIESSFQQAKERYNFVIIDRKENYLKEVRDLLKDIKSQSDLYSIKVRNLLSNLLRDVLAGFLLVGFSLFTKIAEISKLADNKTFLEYVFKGLAIYFILSAIIQLSVDVTDMVISKKEMLYWKNVSREFIPKEEFLKHIADSLKARILSVFILYMLIIACYLIVAIISWQFPDVWLNLYK